MRLLWMRLLWMRLLWYAQRASLSHSWLEQSTNSETSSSDINWCANYNFSFPSICLDLQVCILRHHLGLYSEASSSEFVWTLQALQILMSKVWALIILYYQISTFLLSMELKLFFLRGGGRRGAHWLAGIAMIITYSHSSWLKSHILSENLSLSLCHSLSLSLSHAHITSTKMTSPLLM